MISRRRVVGARHAAKVSTNDYHDPMYPSPGGEGLQRGGSTAALLRSSGWSAPQRGRQDRRKPFARFAGSTMILGCDGQPPAWRRGLHTCAAFSGGLHRFSFCHGALKFHLSLKDSLRIWLDDRKPAITLYQWGLTPSPLSPNRARIREGHRAAGASVNVPSNSCLRRTRPAVLPRRKCVTISRRGPRR